MHPLLHAARRLGDSFRLRAALLAGAVCAGLLLVLALVLGQRLETAQRADQGAMLQSLARAVALSFADGLAERQREITLLARHVEPRRAGLARDAWQPLIDRAQASHRPYTWIGVADPEGRVRAANADLLLGKDVSARPWFQAGREAPWVGDVHGALLLQKLLPPADGEPLRLLDFAAPLRDETGRIVGVLGAHADWRWAGEVIAQLRSEDVRERGVQVFVLDRGGRVIHRPRGVPLDTVPPSAMAHTAVMRWGDGVEALSAALAVPATSPVTDLGWTVVVRQPVREAFAAAQQARAGVLAAAAALSALAVLLTWWVLGRLTRPLSAMAAAAARVRAGALDTRMPRAGGTQELRRLRDALDSMTAHLVDANRTLEARVAARTAELERANAELEKLATHDALTGLHNRRAADARLAAEIARHRRTGAPLAVLLLDIDHFKRINDTLGHAEGDGVLVEVASRLAAAVRTTDFVARTGGEEFVVLLPHTDADGAMEAANKLRLAVAAAPIRAAGTVTVSLGLCAGAQAHSGDTALQAADAALYAAKRGGRNRVAQAGVASEAAVEEGGVAEPAAG